MAIEYHCLNHFKVVSLLIAPKFLVTHWKSCCLHDEVWGECQGLGKSPRTLSLGTGHLHFMLCVLRIHPSFPSLLLFVPLSHGKSKNTKHCLFPSFIGSTWSSEALLVDEYYLLLSFIAMTWSSKLVLANEIWYKIFRGFQGKFVSLLPNK